MMKGKREHIGEVAAARAEGQTAGSVAGGARRVGLAAKFGALLAVILVATLFFQAGWTYYVRTQQAQQQMLVRVQDIATELESVLNSSADADDETRAAIVRGFIVDMGSDSESGISLVRETADSAEGSSSVASSDSIARSVGGGMAGLFSSPDEFEQEAIDALKAGSGGTGVTDAASNGGDDDAQSSASSSDSGAYYRLTTVNGIQVFRYVALLNADDVLGNGGGESASSGGGEDASGSANASGEDSTTYAVSVWIPAENYLGRVGTDALGDVSVSGLVILAALGIILAVARRLLTRPVAAMDEAAARIAAHDFDVHVESKARYRDELDELADHINDMAGELKALYTDLEGKVNARTAELSLANAQLEEKGAQLERANQELREDNEYRVKFLSVMSHELRTPLTSILAFLDIWEREQGPRNDAEAQTMREIRINGKLLLDRVNNILEVSRIDAGRARMDWEDVDPFDLVAQLRATMGPLAENAGIDLQVEADPDAPIIWGDSEKLLRILENLTTNAVKYTQRGGWVRVRIASGAAAGDVVFTVTDNGRGIDAASQAHIFEGFVQARGASAHISEGSGLGLAVVRELVEMHGGSVSLESYTEEEGAANGKPRGTTFTVHIPCNGVRDESVNGTGLLSCGNSEEKGA